MRKASSIYELFVILVLGVVLVALISVFYKRVFKPALNEAKIEKGIPLHDIEPDYREVRMDDREETSEMFP